VWNDGLLATNERLLAIAGGPTSPRHPGRIEVDLNHLTAIVQSGLVLLTNPEDARYQLPVDIKCVDSIVSAAASAAPLIEQRGVDRVEDCRSHFHWTGDHNFYEGFKNFWKIVKLSPPLKVDQLSLRKWKAFWDQGRENQPTADAVAWKQLPPADRPFHDQTAADYSLQARSGNPALGGASDGGNPGYAIDQLPALPDQSASAHLSAHTGQ
jgi:hypothetical protein